MSARRSVSISLSPELHAVAQGTTDDGLAIQAMKTTAGRVFIAEDELVAPYPATVADYRRQVAAL